MDTKPYTALALSARTNTGLGEKHNEDGHTIRDAWVHSMLADQLPTAVERLVAEVKRLTAINTKLCADFNTLNLDGARLDSKIASLRAELDLYKAGVKLASALLT